MSIKYLIGQHSVTKKWCVIKHTNVYQQIKQNLTKKEAEQLKRKLTKKEEK